MQQPTPTESLRCTLAIDGTERRLELGLRYGTQLVYALESDEARGSESLAPLLYRAVRDCGTSMSAIEQVLVSAGPGSYTGLRSAFAFACGIAAAVGCPLVRFPTLVGRLALVRSLSSGVLLLCMRANPKEYFYSVFHVSPSGNAWELEELQPLTVIEDERIAPLVRGTAAHELTPLNAFQKMEARKLCSVSPSFVCCVDRECLGSQNTSLGLIECLSLFPNYQGQILEFGSLDSLVMCSKQDLLYGKKAQALTIAERRSS